MEKYFIMRLLAGSLFVTDLIYQIAQVLREDLERLTVSTRDAGLMELVELWDEG